MNRDRQDRGGGSRRDQHGDRRETRGGPQRHRNAKGRERSGSRGRGGPRRGFSRQRPGERRRESTPSRRAAFEAMQAVALDDAYANLVLPSILRRHRVDARDAAFTTELFYGALRAQGRLDAVIAACVDRPLDQIETAVLNVLRLGAYQMLDMNVAPHAAASETVGLARDVTGAGAAGFVNAVLRRISEKSAQEWIQEVAPTREENEAAHLAVVHSHPEWIVRALTDALRIHGRSAAEIDDLLTAHNTAPQIDLVMRPGLTDEDELADAGAEKGRWSVFGMGWPGGDPGRIPAVNEGRAAVQDEGSQMVALALALGADSLVEGDTGRWLDLCAGPGGKTALLAGLSVEQGAEVLAVEVQEHRTGLVEKSVATLVDAGAEVDCITADGTTIGTDRPGEFSRILADVPCSGLGALRRRPESRWRRQPGDLAQLGRLQRSLLASALDAAAPGGVIAYVTCSPHAAETVLIVKDVLRRRDDAEVVDARDAVQAGLRADAGDAHLGDGPFVQLWPHIHGTDAMFLALIKKKA
ncbi:rRNA small subunit methyltransferase B [Helcobacillus sp. ACRRO]|uniref:RsmB/NOP family class I SAM-dependent RNA methyltransferase n=1 Tax=Helcobacillus sp. ACRRO TaxID=2918202 RepID=UPI001EF6147C|nr:transcription antitermination factor NusB [Helcobacillus sp. ACRRO]MCG7427349.1 rRNA small subunit methyltransferase B [Helcobacillus sp. ACRRO]